MSARRLLPLALLLAACGALLWTALREPGTLRALAIGLLVLWLLLEAPLSFRVAVDDRHGEDRGTLRFNALSRGLALVAALGLPASWAPGWAGQIVALTFFVAGFTLRLFAIFTLGRFYSHTVRRTDGHQVIDTGPYRLVRHPAYLGVIVAHLGFAVVFASPLALLAVLLVIAAFVHRIRVEEPVLTSIPGYPDYARGRARLLPGVW